VYPAWDKGKGSMDQGLFADETESKHELTFFIETQLADSHLGVIRVRELRKGAKRLLKRSHVFLDRMDREKETAGEAIAHLIYEDQTEHRQGKYKGPRWNFQHPTQLHLIQVIERPDPSLGQNEKPTKKEVGTVHIPGELDAPAIIARIAQVIDDGWQPPPDEAYLAPEAPNAGSARSTEPPFPLTVQCMYNSRTLRGPVVFIATEEDGVSIDQCAILLPGEHDPNPSFEWYHLFTFEDTGEALFLCDQGVHAFTEPIFLSTGEYDPPHYWLHEQVRIPVDGGKRVALSRIRSALTNTTACFTEALPSYSVFCSTCRQEYRPALNAPVLQEAARRGYVTTLCPHTFWCPTCERWSTPTERTPRLATSEVCAHPRPTGWESRLTIDAQEMNAPSPESAHSGPSHEHPPLHPYYDDSLRVQLWLADMLYPPRNPGQYLTASTGEVHSEQQPGNLDQVLLVTFLEDCHYETTGGESDFVPKGTRLIGAWNADQPADASVAAIVVNTVAWNMAKDQVTLVPLEEALTQGQIAEEDEAEASRREKQEDHAGAQAFYARAIIEYEASGWNELRLAALRMNRAGLLLLLKQENEAASELERAARAFEAQAHNRLNRTMGVYLEYAEHAVDALVPLATVYLHRTQDRVQARRVLERLLSLNALIKKRYERKVDLLLYIAGFFLALGEQQEALTYFEQANRFYAQQLAAIADFSYVAPITKHLKEVKERLHSVKQSRTVRFTVTAKTPDDLEAVLEQLQKGQLPGVEVTKGVTPQRTSKDARSGLVYVANLRITLDSEKKPTK